MGERLISRMIKDTDEMIQDPIRIMEVCGTHTHAIAQYGIRALINSKIQLLSGPGCPVCVTEENVIDAAIQILKKENTVLATFGDIARVKGNTESILDQRKKGKVISIVYSPFDALEIAESHKDKDIVFLAVGFETTAPLVALTLKLAIEKNLSNLYFLNSLKLMPPVLREILDQSRQIHGMICPGHVAAVMGEEYFRFIETEYNLPAVVAGFDPLDIVGGIHWLVQAYSNQSIKKFNNLYKRTVKYKGNEKAKSLMDEVFDVGEGQWRGIGTLQDSSLKLKKKYSSFDALERFNINGSYKENQYVQCGCKGVLMGAKTPRECHLFGVDCTPTNPLGPCMISTEGSCAAYYRYKL